MRCGRTDLETTGRARIPQQQQQQRSNRADGGEAPCNVVAEKKTDRRGTLSQQPCWIGCGEDAGHRPTCHCLSTQGPMPATCSSRGSASTKPPARTLRLHVQRRTCKMPMELHALHCRENCSQTRRRYLGALSAACSSVPKSSMSQASSPGSSPISVVSRRAAFIYDSNYTGHAQCRLFA